MLELGSEGPRLHAAIAQSLIDAHVDRLYVAGALMRHLWDAAPAAMRAASAPAAAGLIDAISADLIDGDMVMVKGSNGSRVSAVARALEINNSGQPKAAEAS